MGVTHAQVRALRDAATAAGKVAEEVPGPASLLSLNSATFVFDSPAVLALAARLAHAKVAGLGGTVELLTNSFYPEASAAAAVGGGGGSEGGSGGGGGGGGAADAETAARQRQHHCLNLAYAQPPCVRMVAKLHGWLYELRFTLADFVAIERLLRQFGRVEHAASEEELLEAVFTPEEVRASTADDGADGGGSGGSGGGGGGETKATPGSHAAEPPTSPTTRDRVNSLRGMRATSPDRGSASAAAASPGPPASQGVPPASGQSRACIIS